MPNEAGVKEIETIFVFVDDGVVCPRCNESVPPGSLLPCRCIREKVNTEGTGAVRKNRVNR
jgi:hypothetical protein